MGINSGVVPLKTNEELRGITWEYYNREPFIGTIVTPENRNKIIKEKYLEYLSKSKTYEDASDIEKKSEEYQAYRKAREFVLREQKHEKAYLKGKNSFMYKKEKHMVMTSHRLERFKENLKLIEEKYKEGEIDLLDEEE